MFWASFTTWCFQLGMWCFELNFTRFLLMFCFAKTWCVIWQTCAATCGLTTRFRNSTALSHKHTPWCFQLGMWCFEVNFTRFLLMFCFAKTWCVIWQTCAATCGLTTRFRNSTALSHKQIVDNFLHIAKPEVDLTLQGKIHFQQRLVPLHWRKRRGLVSRPALLGSNPTVPTARRVRTQPPLPITRGGPKGHVF